MLSDHLLEGAHKDRDQPVDVAWVVATGRLEDHKCPCRAGIAVILQRRNSCPGETIPSVQCLPGTPKDQL